MIITKAQVAMAASHDYREDYQINEKLNFSLSAQAKESRETDRVAVRGENVFISPQGFSLLELQRSHPRLDLNTQMDARARINLMILKNLYETITGQPMNILEPGALAIEGANLDLEISAAQQNRIDVHATRTDAKTMGNGLVYQRQTRYQEQEKMEFKAEGLIRTADGREIAFSTSLTMSRNYVEESGINTGQGGAKKIDPLVINFDGKGAQLSQTRFNFDLDNNGTEEQIASLHPGSGYLAWDRNGDGIINNGSELFGPTSGLGFSELARFDEDGNHFIDEGDSIYHQLRIWSFNEDGSQQLVALGDKNIGAIFLGHVTSPFQLKDDNNQSLGEISNSGFFLYENGKTGLVQEINLTV